MERSGFDKNVLYIGDGVTVDGTINSNGLIEVLGVASGDITAKEIKIAPGGRIDGTVKADRLDVSGSVSSSINVTDKLTIRSTGRVEGDVVYGSIQIDAGASIRGTIREQGKSLTDKGGVVEKKVVPDTTVSKGKEGSN